MILGAPPATDVTRLMQVRAPFTPLFVLPRAAAGTATQLGAQGELFGQLDPAQREKFWTDSAKSAWSYEDIVSNQLGTRFFLEHGAAINALPAERRVAEFSARLATFFRAVNVVDDQATLDRAARHLPGKERYNPRRWTRPPRDGCTRNCSCCRRDPVVRGPGWAGSRMRAGR